MIEGNIEICCSEIMKSPNVKFTFYKCIEIRIKMHKIAASNSFIFYELQKL